MAISKRTIYTAELLACMNLLLRALVALSVGMLQVAVISRATYLFVAGFVLMALWIAIWVGMGRPEWCSRQPHFTIVLTIFGVSCFLPWGSFIAGLIIGVIVGSLAFYAIPFPGGVPSVGGRGGDPVDRDGRSA